MSFGFGFGFPRRVGAALRATLDFNFLSGLLDPRITFSRTSNATLIGSNGTLQYAPHNLLTYSEQFDNAAWSKQNIAVSANTAQAPDGTITGDTVTRSTGVAAYSGNSSGAGAARQYTMSLYAKAATAGNGVGLRIQGTYPNRGDVVFNLTNGTISSPAAAAGTATGASATIISAGSGWYRCTLTVTLADSLTTCVFAPCETTAPAASFEAASAVASDCYVWGAQLNVGALQPYYSTTVKNLQGFSQEFDNAAWTKSNSTITADVTAAPDGLMTADKLVEDTAATIGHYVTPSSPGALALGQVVTYSAYAKAAERTFLQLILTGVGPAASNLVAGFDLTTGTAGTPSAGSTSSIVAAGNGWYRCSITVPVATANTPTRQIRISLNSSSTPSSYTGDGTSGIFIWGAQLSDSASLDPYVYNPAAAPSNTAYYGPRFDYDPVTLAAKGLLIEEQRTNSIRNNTAQGAVAGTPGTLPTNWFIGNLAGLSTQVVAIGTESGVSYIDLRIFGTSTTTNFILNFEPTTQIPALQNQSWTGSFFVTYVAGTLTNVQNFSTTITERDSAGALLSTRTALGNLTNTPLIQNRYVNSYTLPTATAAYVTLRLDVGVAATSAIDITLRIGLPQLELGAFATSAIPTTTAAATRAADVLSITGANFSSWYNSVEGTMFAEATTVKTSGVTPIATAQNSGGSDRHQIIVFTSTAATVTGGVTQSLIGTNTSQSVRTAYAYKVNDFAACTNGGTVSTDTAGSVPTVNYATLGKFDFGGGESLNGHIRSFKYYPTRLSNSQLQSLTFVPLLWTPAQIPTALWLDAADASTITLNGSTVSQWNDKSGNGRNATQATAANQPTYNPTGFSGKPSLVFDGVNDDLRPTAPDGNTFAVYWVGFGSTNVTTPAQPWFNAPFFSKVFRVGGLFKSGASGQFQVGDYDGADKSVVVPYVFNTPAIFEASKGSGLLTARLNGDVSNTTSIGNSGGFPGIKLGTNYNDTIFLEHTVGEYVHCNEPLSTTDRQKLEGYLAWKWGLQANLPAGHPYKNAAPTV